MTSRLIYLRHEDTDTATLRHWVRAPRRVRQPHPEEDLRATNPPEYYSPFQVSTHLLPLSPLGNPAFLLTLPNVHVLRFAQA
jgi:hypothetical protein